MCCAPSPIHLSHPTLPYYTPHLTTQQIRTISLHTSPQYTISISHSHVGTAPSASTSAAISDIIDRTNAIASEVRTSLKDMKAQNDAMAKQGQSESSDYRIRTNLHGRYT